MPAYSFKERFVPLVKAGTKTQTIRATRKHQIKVGDTVYLYYGMRTRHCMKLGEGVCIKISKITILITGVFVDQKLLEDHECERLAKADGFKNFEDMWQWWYENNALPFKGEIIYWKKSTNEQIKN